MYAKNSTHPFDQNRSIGDIEGKRWSLSHRAREHGLAKYLRTLQLLIITCISKEDWNQVSLSTVEMRLKDMPLTFSSLKANL